jgi:hypothetical protein
MVNARRKGQTFERTIANRLKSWPGLEDARRGKTQSAGAIEPDVWAPWPFWCECKHGMSFSAVSAFAQAERDAQRAKSGNAPLVVARQTRGDVFFVVRRTDAERHLGVEIAEGVLHDAAGAVVSRIAQTKSWRTLLPALRALPVGGVGEIIEGGYLFGWFDTLERLWRSKQ